MLLNTATQLAHLPLLCPLRQTSFLTPAEMFSPWYGACIARHMVEHRRWAGGRVGDGWVGGQLVRM